MARAAAAMAAPMRVISRPPVEPNRIAWHPIMMSVIPRPLRRRSMARVAELGPRRVSGRPGRCLADHCRSRNQVVGGGPARGARSRRRLDRVWIEGAAGTIPGQSGCRTGEGQSRDGGDHQAAHSFLLSENTITGLAIPGMDARAASHGTATWFRWRRWSSRAGPWRHPRTGRRFGMSPVRNRSPRLIAGRSRRSASCRRQS